MSTVQSASLFQAYWSQVNLVKVQLINKRVSIVHALCSLYLEINALSPESFPQNQCVPYLQMVMVSKEVFKFFNIYY